MRPLSGMIVIAAVSIWTGLHATPAVGTRSPLLKDSIRQRRRSRKRNLRADKSP